MDKEYIEREPLIHELKDRLCIYPARVRRAIVNAPAADVVSRDLFKQIKWERDIAMTQLEEHGIAFGMKKEYTDVTKVRHGYWIDRSNGWRCSECERYNTHDKPYCPNCGAKMDGGKNG